MAEDISAKIKNGIYKVTSKRKGRSEVWKLFGEIQKDDGCFVSNIVCCRDCTSILKFNGKQTSNLVRHKCFLKNKNAVPRKNINAEKRDVLKAHERTNQNPAIQRYNVLKSCVDCMVTDCRPFYILKGNEFENLLQHIIRIGAQWGENVDIDDLMPEPTTASKYISVTAQDQKKDIKEMVQKAVNIGRCTVTIDMWNDDFVRRNYLCATIHFFKDSILKQIVLGLNSMQFQRTTGENMRKKLEPLFLAFGISDWKDFIFISDRDTNIEIALKNNVRLNCCVHLLDNVLEEAFNATNELQLLMEDCKKTIKYLKKTNVRHLLDSKLKNQCATRWNTHFRMFKSIHDNWPKINEILVENSETQKMDNINYSILKELVKMCECFEIISKKLQGTQYITLNYVYPSITRLRKICEIDERDFQPIITLKQNIIQEIENKWIPNLDIRHKAAVFLYPPTNNILDEITKKEIKDFCISQMNNSSYAVPDSAPLVHRGAPSTSKSTQKLSASLSTDFDFFFGDLVNEGTQITPLTSTQEIDKYSKMSIQMDNNFDAMKWWENQTYYFPNLSKVALNILSIPASSVASERAFSLAGTLLVERRNRLSPKILSDILLLSMVENIF